ncbi:MAG: methyl-accepting chemotaxis protein [Oscillospiraceae bacterium]|nr:methyl-accepting chemotaxis protein [Oscillospiraceae bacterium]MCL2279707.1 methyl-accepting chemotaxis protein [Oscillospiraceae bacterium]
MKNKSLKLAIILPSLAILIIGIVVMIVIVGTLSSNATGELTEQLLQARVSENSNEFKVFNEKAQGILNTITPIVMQHRAQAATGAEENVREEVVSILTDVLLASDIIVGAWSVWEPNAFDGRDSEFAGTEFHDDTGRFVPYVFKDGNNVIVEALVGYDDPVDGDFYMGVRNSGRAHATDPYIYNVAGRDVTMFSLALPILDNGVVSGAVGLDINLNDISHVMNEVTILDDGYLFSLSPGGYFTTHSNSDLLTRHFTETWLSDYRTQIEEVLSNGGSFSLVAYSSLSNINVEFLAKGVPIGNTGQYWLVGGIVPETSVTAASTTLVWTIIAVGAALVVIMAVSVYFIVGKSLKKLPILTAIAEDISIGGVDAHGLDNGTTATKNEITHLERAFVKMAEGIKTQAEVMSKIADGDYSVSVESRSNHDVMNQAISKMLESTNDTLNQISTATEQVTTGSRQVADGAQSLAQGSTEQASSIEDLSRSIADIAKMTKENADIAARTSALSSGIRDNAEKGSRQMDEMMKAVDEINESSKNIGKIIKTIDDIAFQTNILALNAAVEAARAGQHGKGFAVVAEEVRNLASKSAEAAKDTGDMIQQSIEKAELGSRIAGETSASLNEIVAGIKESTEFIAEIAKASGEQAEGITRVNTGIDQVGQVVSQNSATAQESAASSEEISGQADMLQQLIGHFKLKDSGNSFVQSLPSAQIPGLPAPINNNHFGEMGKY